jgi:transcriptional/translational regulatory protein YebC/TACO1
VIRVGKGSISEDTLQAIARDAGAGEILSTDPAAYVILTPPAALEGVRGVLEDHEVGVLSADLEQLPSERVGLEDGAARKVLGFLHALEAHADVKRVWSDADLSPELLSDRGGRGA